MYLLFDTEIRDYIIRIHSNEFAMFFCSYNYNIIEVSTREYLKIGGTSRACEQPSGVATIQNEQLVGTGSMHYDSFLNSHINTNMIDVIYFDWLHPRIRNGMNKKNVCYVVAIPSVIQLIIFPHISIRRMLEYIRC